MKNVITFTNTGIHAGTKIFNSKKMGKCLRKFYEDCKQYADFDLNKVAKKDYSATGQLFSHWVGCEDCKDEVTVTTNFNERKETLNDFRLGTLVQKFIKHSKVDLSKATKKDDEDVGGLFITFFTSSK